MPAGIRATVDFSPTAGCPIAQFARETGTVVDQVSTSVGLPSHGPSRTEFLSSAEDTPAEGPFDPIFAYGDATLYRVAHDDAVTCPCECLGRFGCPVHRYIADGVDRRQVIDDGSNVPVAEFDQPRSEPGLVGERREDPKGGLRVRTGQRADPDALGNREVEACPGHHPLPRPDHRQRSTPRAGCWPLEAPRAAVGPSPIVPHHRVEFTFDGETLRAFLEAFFAEHDVADLLLAETEAEATSRGWAPRTETPPGNWAKNPECEQSRRYARITVDGRFNETLDGLDTRLEDGDRVALMHPFLFCC